VATTVQVTTTAVTTVAITAQTTTIATTAQATIVITTVARTQTRINQATRHPITKTVNKEKKDIKRIALLKGRRFFLSSFIHNSTLFVELNNI
jgi:hypothetical protein